MQLRPYLKPEPKLLRRLPDVLLRPKPKPKPERLPKLTHKPRQESLLPPKPQLKPELPLRLLPKPVLLPK